MADVKAEELFESGRSHALAATLLFDSSKEYARREGIEDAEKFAFNGTFSLSVHYLIGLGFELMLKAAYLHRGGNADSKHLRNEIGHDLIKALDLAESVGFQPHVENLREILEYLRDPYLRHFFRYSRPSEVPLPEVQVISEVFAILDQQLCEMFGWQTYQ